MAKGQYLSRHQKGIVNRFYLHRGSILITRLQELVSDLALAEGKKAESLWKRAGETMRKLETEPPIPESKIAGIIESRDVAEFAKFVGELHAKV